MEGKAIELLVDISLLGMLVLTSVFVVRCKDLLAVVLLFSIYGLLSASFFMTMDAVDVAFTEAAVGAGISPLLMLASLAIVGRHQAPRANRPIAAFLLVVVTGALLILGTLDMPAFGSATAPAQLHVAPHYLVESVKEIGIPNVVTSVLGSYRGFDTLGEVVVIFAAGIGVLSILGTDHSVQRIHLIDHVIQQDEHKILHIVSKILIPAILLFALYVQFHGDFGPGGGFQAGVIFAAAIILYTMFFGLSIARQVINESLVRLLAAIGVLIYGVVGLLSFFSGKNYLDYHALAENPQTAQHIGILAIELGVGITVASVMILIFFAFTESINQEQEQS